jgi:hypothetical protein
MKNEIWPPGLKITEAFLHAKSKFVAFLYLKEVGL